MEEEEQEKTQDEVIDAVSPEPKHVSQPLQKQNATGYLIFCNIIVVMGSAFMFGFNAAVINAPFDVMSAYVNASFAREGKLLNAADLSTMWSLVVALHLIGGVVGSVWFPAYLMRTVGRRNGLMIAATIGAVGASCSFITPWTNSYGPLMVGRSIVGVATGLSMVMAPGLITEQAPARLRGSLGSTLSMGSAIGVTVANLLGLPHILGRSYAWQYLFLFVTAVYILHIVCLIFVVDSPKFLIDHKKYEEAMRALTKLRGGTEDEVRPEFEEDKYDATHHELQHDIPITEIFRHRTFYWPLIIVINLHIINQLTGLGAAFYYATKVMKGAGLDGSSAALANFGISFGTIFGNILEIFLVDRIGRRPLMLAGLAVVCGANVMLTVVIQQHIMEASAVGFAIFLISFSSGPGPLPFFMSAELTSRSARPIALTVGMFTNWSGKILVSFIFPIMQLNIGPYCFLPFAGVSFLEFFFMLLFLPETSHHLEHHFHVNMFGHGHSLLHLIPPKPPPAKPADVAAEETVVAPTPVSVPPIFGTEENEDAESIEDEDDEEKEWNEETEVQVPCTS